MKNDYLIKKLNSQKGSALAISISVIMVLTALGLVALMSSAVNVNMSGKSQRWSKDFYRLDAKAAEYERMIDEALVQAEKDAREYVVNRMDRLKPGELTGVYADHNVYNMKNTGAQQFFRDYYLIDWTYENGSDVNEYTLDDYLDYTGVFDDDGKPKISEISEWFEKNPGESPTRENIINAFTSDIKSYASQLFDRVYFYMLSIRLENLVDSLVASGRYGDIIIKDNDTYPGDAGYDMAPGYLNPDYFATDKYNNFSGVPALSSPRDTAVISAIKAKWTSIEPKDDDIGLYIRVNQASLGGDSLDDPKKVYAYISIIKPEQEVILKHIYMPLKGNPIWANALSAQGSIVFADSGSADATIRGDVYASSGYGIKVGTNAKVNIYGNVYTPGNLQIVGDNGTLGVFKNTTESYEAKNKIYDENGLNFVDFFDDTVLDVDKFTESFIPGAMPFIFKDAVDKGNVYCRDLIAGVEDSPVPVRNASLTVSGNIWTSDDIQMDAQNSLIRIGSTSENTYYVGLNPFSSLNDPNASSSVINNYSFDINGNSDSRIYINSKFCIPGVAFYKFAGNQYYKSLESVASRRTLPTPLINAYITDENSGIVYVDEDGVEYNLRNTATNEVERKRKFWEFVDNQGGIRTNVLTDLDDSRVDGYAAEIAPIQHRMSNGSITDADLYTSSPEGYSGEHNLPNSTANGDTFQQFVTGGSNYLMDIFNAKTKKLGTNEASGSFSNFVDEAMLSALGTSDIISLTGPAGLDLEDYDRGIVYCRGDLTIYDSNLSHGTNTFNGTIICTGDVTVREGVTLIYDEGVILEKLKYSGDLRKFFDKGNRGKPVAYYEEYSTSSGERKIIKRYKIKEWREVTA